MSDLIQHPSSKPLKLLAGAAVAALLVAWAGGVGAQTTSDPQQASLPPASSTTHMPALPLGHDDVREVQNQLISLGFDPGPADGQLGPATTAAAQQYDQNRGGDGRVSIDAELLARLKADNAPRLTYDQVAARSQARGQAPASGSAPASASSSASSSGAGQFGSIVQQVMPLIGAAIANSNSNNNYGPGYYGPGPGYYGPGPGYYGPGYYRGF